MIAFHQLDTLCDAVALYPISVCALNDHDLSAQQSTASPQTVVLLAPKNNDFWEGFKNSSEFSDKGADPLDRYSKRICTKLAAQLNAHPVFPSDGPPYPPFIAWALRSGAVHQSPIGLLVHEKLGLFISFRAALIFDGPVPDAPQTPSPCLNCTDQPCLTACPVQAMGPKKDYDVQGCKTHLNTDRGFDCLNGGCLVRRACPASIGAERRAEQSAFHMKAFLCPN